MLCLMDAVKVEQEVKDLTKEDVYKFLLKTVKSWQGDRFNAVNDDTTKAIDGVMDHIKLKAPGIVLAA